MCDLKKEDITIRIREKLRTDQIKLWLDPYYTESEGTNMEEIKRLSKEFSSSLKISFESCFEVLNEMQENSLENLKQRTKFNASGLATLKIKIIHEKAPPKITRKEVMLTDLTSDLKNMILEETLVGCASKLKLISSGKVLVDDQSLTSQGIRNGQLILALILGNGPHEIEKTENQMREVEEIKNDSKLLALDHEYLQLEDQFGNAVKIPPAEKKALVVAMALQEKGRAALKKGDLSKALVLFLEADQEFRLCNSQVLTMVDNYALLDLDIAWCYLCLESVANLPDAHERLRRCEATFARIYGPNLERVLAVKGSSGNEAALLVRLHLLQAIVLYHQNKREQALHLLQSTEHELNKLKVDEDSILRLTELGYTVTEARIGLRANGGNVNTAAIHINALREKKVEARVKTQLEELLAKERKKLGICDDGKQYVEPQLLKSLVDMGFDKKTAKLALKKTNNNISESIQYIQENRDLSIHKSTSSSPDEEVPSTSASPDKKTNKPNAAERKLLKEAEKQAKDEALGRMNRDFAQEDEDYLDIPLVQEEEFLQQYLELLQD